MQVFYFLWPVLLMLPISLWGGVALALETLSIPQEVGIPFLFWVPWSQHLSLDWKGQAVSLLCVPGTTFL